MHYVFFSKFVREFDIPRLIEALQYIGVDGVDLCVRDGYPVNPGNARKALPEAAERLRTAGLSIPMVTTPGDFTDPNAPVAEELFAACHDAQIPFIKLGYWQYKPGNYWKQVEDARRDMEGFARIAARYGVKACLHTHSGYFLGVNTAAAMHLVQGLDPAHIGVYLDPGHLALNGEPLSMAFEMAGEYLSLIALKDSRWVQGEDGRPRRAEFLPMGAGFVDWREMTRLLLARDFAGPLSFHSEFESPSTEQRLEQTRKDVAFMRRIESEVRAGM
jgi:sugar phosphate isomerase/epimerase